MMKTMCQIDGKGYSSEPWFGSYRSMIQRCYLSTAHNFPMYGGRGIRVCSEWHDIENFKKWVDNSDYKKGMSIDRINVNEDYSPNSCRWATSKMQANNRRNTIKTIVNGKEYTISELAAITGIKRSTVNNRYTRGDRGERLIREVRKCG